MTQRYLAPVREARPNEMSPQEIDRQVRALWENVAEEAGDRRGLVGMINRTYLLARDLQQYAEGSRVRWLTLIAVPRFFYNVLARSRGMALAQ